MDLFTRLLRLEALVRTLFQQVAALQLRITALENQQQSQGYTQQ